MATEGGLAPARHDMLQACALPEAWAGQPQWRILETRFGHGLDFLAAWRAWQDDPQRPRILHFVSIAESPPAPDALLVAAQPWPQLQPLAQTLAAQSYGLLPGVHRLVFEHGHMLLTLCVGDADKMLRQQDFHADTLFLHENDASGAQAAAQAINLKALARCCRRGTRIALKDCIGELAPALARHGFRLAEQARAADLACGEFDPAWEPRGPRPPAAVVPGDCIVIGAGLAGAAAAASMARRGWKVQVLDAAPSPAAGASGLPAGVLVPHSSPDDNLLSRLSRAGVRATLQQAQALLQAGRDWAPSGVLEHHVDGAPAPSRLPLTEAAAVWSRPADAAQKRLAGIDASAAADWHEKAAWVQPAALVHGWLAQPGVQLKSGAQVSKLVREAGQWQALDSAGAVLARGELVIVAAACASGQLLEGLTLQPVRGQVTWALHEPQLQLPPFPVNGDGSFIPSVPTAQGPAWFCGASFDREDTDPAARAADDLANLARLRRILPATATQLEEAFSGGQVQAWTGIRCASTDRRPLVGPLDEQSPDGLWLSTAMGSRGLTFAALSAELIAARIHGEPLPLARNLARALYPARQKKGASTRADAGE